MRVLLSAMLAFPLALALSFLPALAQDQIPERRLVVTKNIDFYGADLQALFDTTYGACEKVCLSDPACQAFTFNTRSNACFPKSQITDQKPYDGAWSAQVLTADPAVRAQAGIRAAEMAFIGSRDIGQAREQAERIGGLHPAGQWTPEQLLDAARERRAQGDLLNALRWTGSATSKTDHADQWLDYARRSLDLANTSNKDKRLYQTRALSASVNAYLRSTTAPQRVSILEVMAEALEINDRGRDMIPALRMAEQLQPRAEITAALERAIGKYGFRITEHQVESDSAAPRLCAVFSEPLVKVGVDYATYVKLPDLTMSVTASGEQLCIDGAEHGKRYRVIFREGLPAASGEAMAKDVELTLYVRDRSPAVRFPGRAYVLPRAADAALPIETVNLGKVNLKLRRVSDRNILRAIQDQYFGRPLSYWEERQFNGEIAEEVWTGTGETGKELNRDMTTRLPLGEVLTGLPTGIYALTAEIPGADPHDTPGATQWFVLSDLGMTSLQGGDGVHVFLRGLGDAQARAGVKVTLLSRANSVLGTAMTDPEGYARFEAGLTRGTGGSSPALVMAEAGDDLAFLSLTDPAFDLSDRGVQGREPSPPMDVFLATDRGAYRADEVIHATVLARDQKVQGIAGLPLTAILFRPDGVEYARHLSSDDLAGGHVFNLPVGATAPRGTWRLEVRADVDAVALASTTLLVEDFLPERIDFTMTLPEGQIRVGDTPPLSLEARYLFGAPAADLAVEGDVLLRAAAGLPDWPDYRFGLQDEGFYSRTKSLATTRTDAAGKATLAVDMPEARDADRPVEMRLTLRVAEGSGRPVERRLSHLLTPAKPMIGIKPLFDGTVPEGTEAALNVVAIGPDLKPTPMAVRWTVNRVERRYQWYQQYGNWNWEPVTSRQRIATGEAQLGTEPLQVKAPVNWGQYELVVERLDGAYVAASRSFYAGWYAPVEASDTPDTLELSLDKPAYRSGDVARLRLVPRYDGVAMVQVMSNRLIAMKAVPVTKGENLIALEVTDDWGAGAYVTASVIRPMDVAAGRNPARALGLSYAPVDPEAKQLRVRLDAPEQSDPRSTLSAVVHVDGITAGESAYVTVAAVDLGILNLTSFASPDPSKHYFGQQRLGMEIRDIYGRLIDGMNGAMGQVRSGGDASARMRMESPPPTEELVAYFTGPVTIGPDGTAEVHFDIPEFNGTVRLMAVAWSPTAVGQASADVILRDPVVVTASLPRFLAPGDTSRLLLEVVHADGPAGRMGLDITARGVALNAALIPSGLTLEKGEKQSLSLPITAFETGDHTLRIALTTPDGKQLVKSLTLPVRANDPEVSQTRRFSLDAGDTFILDANVFAGLRQGTGHTVLAAGPLARLNAPAMLAALDRYPYGCTEQVTSRAMPLLYLDQVAEALGYGNRARIQARVDQAIEQVLTRQANNGAFGLWRADSGDFWLDAYVSDFLSRARTEGYTVPDLAFRLAMDNLRNRVNYAPAFDEGGTDIAYALMVLAREGAAAMGDLRYYADEKGDDFTTPLAAAQLGAALASYGDQTRADAMFARAARLMMPRMGDESPVWRADYGSNLRDAAGVLSLAVEAGSTVINRTALADRIGGADRGLSTQEAVWSLLAARALVTDPTVAGLEMNGIPVTGPMVRSYDDTTLAPVAIRNTRGEVVNVTLTTLGVPDVPVAAGGYGYTIERLYFTPKGAPVTDLTTIRAGDRLVTVLRITPFEPAAARLMVNDPLPAGFEIDNPTLLRSGDVDALDWLNLADTQTTEFRSDRFLAAVDWRSDASFDLAYMVRAISPGAFHHPAATVEDMYRPEYRARTATTQVVIGE